MSIRSRLARLEAAKPDKSAGAGVCPECGLEPMPDRLGARPAFGWAEYDDDEPGYPGPDDPRIKPCATCGWPELLVILWPEDEAAFPWLVFTPPGA